MPPPSVNLLRATRATKFIQTCLPLSVLHRSRHPCSSPPSRSHIQFPQQASPLICAFSSTPVRNLPSAPKSTERGPTSKEDTQTHFGTLNVLGNSPPPTTAIDACLSDGFHLDNGLKISEGSGCFLLGGEAFSWRPWMAGNREGTSGKGRMMNRKGQWDVENEAWGLLELVWPKPGNQWKIQGLEIWPLIFAAFSQADLLILGLGPSVHPISPETRRHINSLGIRVDVQDTRNAAAQFNLLATERGVANVAAALIPIGWKEPK